MEKEAGRAAGRKERAEQDHTDVAAECAEIRMETAEVEQKMTDRECYIRSLENIREMIEKHRDDIYGSTRIDSIINWTIDYLKDEEEAEGLEMIKPLVCDGFISRKGRKTPTIYRCGICKRRIPAKRDNYCPHCGRKVDWRDT